MPSYKAPVEDVLFLLNDVLGFHRYDNLRGFSDAAPDVMEAVLNEGAKLAETVLAPLVSPDVDVGAALLAGCVVFALFAAGTLFCCSKTARPLLSVLVLLVSICACS